MTFQYLELKIEELEKRIEVLEQDPKYCDRNICLKNEYNNIGCDECEDAINREDVIALVQCSEYELQDRVDNDAMCDDVRKLLSVKSQEPKTGHWRAVYQGDEIINYRCSECEFGDTNGSTMLYGWNYCRRCGAKMIEPQESEEL